MSIADKFRPDPIQEYDQWRKSLRRRFWTLMVSISSAWVAAGAFTVWLLRR